MLGKHSRTKSALMTTKSSLGKGPLLKKNTINDPVFISEQT